MTGGRVDGARAEGEARDHERRERQRLEQAQQLLPLFAPAGCRASTAPRKAMTAAAATAAPWPRAAGTSTPRYSPMTIAIAAADPAVLIQSLQPTTKPA